MLRRSKLIISLILGVAVFSSFAGDVVYNRFNIHYYARQSRGKVELMASYANYVAPSTGHGFVPYNSEIKIGRYRGGFAVIAGDKKIFFQYHKVHMGMSMKEYLELITAPQKVVHKDLSGVDKEGIREGKAKVGMTKTGIKVALGYPAKHKTPSLEEDTWTYWRNRFMTQTVVFKDGKVSAIQ